VAELPEPRCTVAFRSGDAERPIVWSGDRPGADGCADLIRDGIASLSHEDLDLLRSTRDDSDVFVGLFADRRTAFPFPRSVWTTLAATDLPLVFDFYPPGLRDENALGGRETELVVEGPLELVTRIRARCPGLGGGRPVVWTEGTPNEGRSLRLRFRSANGQGAAVLGREAITLLESHGADLEIVLTD